MSTKPRRAINESVNSSLLRNGSLRHRAEAVPAGRAAGAVHSRADPVQAAVRESPYAAALLVACIGWLLARTHR